MEGLSVRLDHTVSEASILAFVTGFIINCCPNITIETEKALPNRQRFYLRVIAPDEVGGGSLLIAFKRLHPSSEKFPADIALKRIDASSAAAARKLLQDEAIAPSKQRFHGSSATVNDLEQAAMAQCKRYRDVLQTQTRSRIRCATAIHVTVANGVGSEAQLTSTFLVSVE
jgi:hypothetical protein